MTDLKFYELQSNSDLRKRQELFIECFPETKDSTAGSLEHFHWKFRGTRQAWNYLASNGEDIIGGYSAILFHYRLNRETDLTSGMVCDVMTGVNARGKGVFTKLGAFSTERLLERVDFLSGFPIREEVLPGHLKIGWQVLCKLPLYVNVVRIDTKLNNIGVPKIISKTAQNIFSFIGRTFVKKTPNYVLYDTWNEFISGQESDFEVFQKTSNPWSGFRLDRNIEYIKWRLSAPNREYKIIVLYDLFNSSISDIAIVREIDKEGLRCLCVLDLMTNNTNSKLPIALKAYARDCRVDVILMMADSNSHKKFKLIKSFWFKTGKHFSWIIKSHNNELIQNIKKAQPSLFWLDCDDL